MKKIFLLVLILNLELYSYSQDSVKFSVHRIRIATREYGEQYSIDPNSKAWGNNSRLRRRVFYKIGNEEEKRFDADFEVYRNHISADEEALKFLKRYRNSLWTRVGGAGILIVGMPVTLFAPPVGLILIGTGLVTMTTTKDLGFYFIKKSGKIFNRNIEIKKLPIQ